MELKLLDVFKREWLYIFKTPKIFAILFIVPIAYTLLFGYAYSAHTLTEIKTVVVDYDNSQLSRQIIQAFHESESFQITGYVNNEKEIEEALALGEVKVGLVIPENFYGSLIKGENVPLLTLIDGSNLIFTNYATRAANTIVSTYSFGTSATKLQQAGLHEAEVISTLSHIPYRSRILYNPTSNYSTFLVYGLVGTILQQVLFLGVSLTITREKENGMWSHFAQWKYTPWNLALVKTAPYFLINLINTLTTLYLCLYLFKLPLEGNVLPLFVLSCSFAFSVLGFGYLASLFADTQLTATQVTMLVAVPSFVLSGYTWPFEGIPNFLVGVAQALPLTHYLEGFRHIVIKGNSWDYIWNDIISLLLIGMISFLLAFLATRFLFFRENKGTLLSDAKDPFRLDNPEVLNSVSETNQYRVEK
ncbi:ABC transporter permease [Ureibacillus thermosphaericus]|uniref:ABC transporter permease n=1 Tax=Ureibacillus thermosphaericus TaxID=51173 RepID=UPI0030C93834